MTTLSTCSRPYSSPAATWTDRTNLAFWPTGTRQAVILNIVVLGEAATKLANDHPAFVALHQDVPWHSMRGMRNRMAHGYFDVDLAIVWQTVKSSLPSLAQRLAAIRDGMSSGDGQTHDGA
jgi:uncharacterized protein with HEPN domain